MAFDRQFHFLEDFLASTMSDVDGVSTTAGALASQSRAAKSMRPSIRRNVFCDGPFKTLADVELATAGWVDWYNNRRLHSSLAMVPPVEDEQAHYAALTAETQPA